MAAENDLKTDFDDAYQNSVEKWWPFWREAKTDIKFTLNDPWSESDKTKLKKQERDALKWNRVRRMVNLLSGWERRNRLSIKLNPIEGADRKTIDQMSGVVQYAWQKGGAYQTISDAYYHGPLMTGLALVEIYIDYTNDPINGDVKFVRLPYNRFLLDPFVTDLSGLTDCSYLLTRDYMSKDQIKLMLPIAKGKEIERTLAQGRDAKYPDAPAAKDFKGKNLYKVDRFFRRTTMRSMMLVEPNSGKNWEYKGNKAQLQELLASEHPAIPGKNWGQLVKPFPFNKMVVKLGLLIEDKVYYDDDEPHGLEDYPFSALGGYFTPESDDFRIRLSGVVRDMRDPQTDSNRRRMKFIDIMDNFLDAVVAKKGALVNPKQAYQRGPMVLWMNEGDADHRYEVGKDVQILRGGGAVPGLLEGIQLADKDMEEIPGGNETLLGLPSKDDPQEAWIMGKLRTMAGLTIFEPLIDNLRNSCKALGDKSLRMIQANYPKTKVARIINEPPTDLFYDKDFTRYDVLAVQGLQTETQKQMKYAQLMALAQMPQFQGKIPLSMLLEASDLELGTDFIKQLQQGEAMEKQLKMLQLKEMLTTSETQSATTRAKGALYKAQEQKALADAVSQIAKIMDLPLDRMHKLMELAMQLDKEGGFGLEPSQAQLPAPGQGQGGPPNMPITTR